MKEEIKNIVEILLNGGIILYPCDTVWAIGCDATNALAIERIYLLKKRADTKSMLVLVNGIDMLNNYVHKVPDIAKEMIKTSIKPLTIIYPKAVNLPANLAAIDGSIGIRIVQHEFCSRLIKQLNRPLVSTSANISGSATPLSYSDISAEIIGGVDYAVNPQFEEEMTHKPSSIVSLGVDGEVKIIRE
jgi:L-threonylcarbamoyladenylate synthase